MEEMYKKQIPMQRYGDHEELANLAVFLMSDLAPYINGSCITIDGGEHLKSGQFNFIDQLMPRDQLKQLFASLKPKK
jgi:enoyl-[acyl-carrier-protein] reductase (NADH)